MNEKMSEREKLQSMGLAPDKCERYEKVLEFCETAKRCAPQIVVTENLPTKERPHGIAAIWYGGRSLNFTGGKLQKALADAIAASDFFSASMKDGGVALSFSVDDVWKGGDKA